MAQTFSTSPSLASATEEGFSRWFRERTGWLATMHGKETAIAPLLQTQCGITLQVPQRFNTDAFGTFTREIPRPDTQRATARLKAQRVLETTGGDLAIASEGAFFPHPALPMLSCDRELVLLLDHRHGIEVVGEILSTETNFAHRRVDSPEAALDFAAQVGFPSHALVVSIPHCPDTSVKGIRDRAHLMEVVAATLPHSPDHTAQVETDMRAMMNPTRMAVIRQATEALIHNLQQPCPRCACPGFVEKEVVRGLPCEFCGLPTPLIKASIHRCQRCHYQEKQPFPDGLTSADPSQCQFCNP